MKNICQIWAQNKLKLMSYASVYHMENVIIKHMMFGGKRRLSQELYLINMMPTSALTMQE